MNMPLWGGVCYLVPLLRMKLELDQPRTDRYHIDSYSAAEIRVNGICLTNSLVITPLQIIDNWPPRIFEEIALHHIDQIIRLQPEVMLLGTGRRLCMLSPQLTAHIQHRGIGLEVMDTGAACRCYNLLMSEGRNVAAGLLLPDPPAR